MNLVVSLQRIPSVELFPTVIAKVGILSGVDPLMSYHLTFLCKSFITQFTLERFFPSVNQQMAIERYFFSKSEKNQFVSVYEKNGIEL